MGLGGATGCVVPCGGEGANKGVWIDHARLKVGVKKTEELPRKPVELITAEVEFFEVAELANRWKYLSQVVQA